MDKWSIYKKCDDFRVAAPKSVQDLVEVRSIAENGIFEVGKGGIFTKTYKFSDINFQTASVDEQIFILESWCRWLNSHSVPFKITFNNKNKNMATLREEVYFKKHLDEFDDLRGVVNDEIEDRIINGRTGIETELYLTIRYDASTSYEDARVYFSTMENNMIQSFRSLGSELVPLDATERLRILHDFYRFGNEEYFNFDFKKSVECGFDFKDAIVNTRLDFSEETYFRTDDKYVSAIFLKQYPTKLSDRFLTNLSKLNVKMMCSIDIAPISDSDVDDMLKSIYLGVEDRIRKQTKRRVKELDFNSQVSLAVRMDQSIVEKMIKEKNEDEQHFFYVMLNILVISDSLEQLKKDVDLVRITAKNSSVILDYSYMKQKEALNTVLPIGVRQVANGKNLQTKSLASLFPFNIQELFSTGGNWYGHNCVSKNLCMTNRKQQINAHGFVFGVTGSGKTTAAKIEILENFLNTNDDIIIVDPKGDYKDICNLLKGSYVDISTVSETRYNPLEYYETQDKNKKRASIADEKSELLLSIVETCKRTALTAQERSIVNRATKFAYNEASITGKMPTLKDIYNVFDKFDEPEAKDIKLVMELFVEGSLSIFSEESNTDLTNRLIVFGLKGMGQELRDLSMLVMLECIKERIYKNAEKGITTWLYIDEFHEVLHTNYSQEYIKKLWMLIRSLHGIITALTQNVTDVMLNDTTKAMVENSEFLMLFKQKTGAVRNIKNELGLSEELIKYVTSESMQGRGIIRSGSVTIPFDFRLKEDSPLFALITKNA